MLLFSAATTYHIKQQPFWNDFFSLFLSSNVSSYQKQSRTLIRDDYCIVSPESQESSVPFDASDEMANTALTQTSAQSSAQLSKQCHTTSTSLLKIQGSLYIPFTGNKKPEMYCPKIVFGNCKQFNFRFLLRSSGRLSRWVFYRCILISVQ